MSVRRRLGLRAAAVLLVVTAALAATASAAWAARYSVALEGSPTVTQGRVGTPRSVTFAITRAPATAPGSVSYSTMDGSARGDAAGARAPVDYEAVSGRAAFAAGVDHVEVTVKLIGDDLYEPAQRFSLVIDHPQGDPAADALGDQRAGVTLLSSAPAPCQAAPSAGDHPIVISVDGRLHRVLVHVPAGLDAGRHLPLLLALHGLGADGPTMARYTGLSTLADHDAFIVAYPSAERGQWHLYGSQVRAERDVDFLRATVDRLSSGLCVDRRRRFVAGVSNGAGEAARLACEMGDRLAGIATVAGDYRRLPPCHPPRPESVLEIHGARDPVVPYEGRGPAHAGSVPKFLRMWRDIDGCREPGLHHRVDAYTERSTWTCAGHTSVSQLKIANLGHAWPCAYPPPGRVPGPGSAAYALWSFFSSRGPRGH